MIMHCYTEGEVNMVSWGDHYVGMTGNKMAAPINGIPY